PPPDDTTLTDARRNVEAAFGDAVSTSSTGAGGTSEDTRPEQDRMDGNTVPETAAIDGSGPPDGTDGTNEMSDDESGDLPKRDRRDERELPQDERNRVVA